MISGVVRGAIGTRLSNRGNLNDIVAKEQINEENLIWIKASDFVNSLYEGCSF